MRRFTKPFFFYFCLFLVLYSNLTVLIGSNPVTITSESFENYPIGSYSSLERPFFSFESWFPSGVDSPTATIVNNQSYTGEQSVRIFIDGTYDDGSIWFLKTFSVDTNVKQISVKLRGSIWSAIASDINTWPVIAFIDTFIPTSSEQKQEEDFQIIGQTEQEVGWTTYEYTQNVTFQETNTFYVAFGISVWWETERVYWIDDLEVDTQVIMTTPKIASDAYFLIFISTLISLPFIRKKLWHK